MSLKHPYSQQLGLFTLVMIAVISVDSLRNLPISAQYGYSLVTFYAIAGVLFFFPLAWITGKLAIRYPETGGSYLWVKAAFGPSFGYLAIWLQWIYNIIWYPTIFVFINTILVSSISPGLEKNKFYIFISSLIFFWIISGLHTYGIRLTRWISTASAILGALLPMTAMAVLAFYWLYSGQPTGTPFTWHALLPQTKDLHNLGFFSNILFSLLGLEVIAMHAGNVKNPQRTYPRALLLSSIIIFLTIVLSSLALCIILPVEKISLIGGLAEVLTEFFSAYHMPYASQCLRASIIIGGFGIASSWMVALARGLHVSLSAIPNSSWLQKLNRHQMPSRILFIQCLIYSFLLTLFLFFQDLNNSYWILSALTAQFALLYYILIFVAAVKLLHQQEASRQKMPLFLAGMACFTCLIGIIVGFLPPSSLPHLGRLKYEMIMLGGFISIGIFPALLFCYGLRARKWDKK